MADKSMRIIKSHATEALARLVNRVARTGIGFAHTGDDVARMGNGVARPGNGFAHTENRVARTGNGVAKMGNSFAPTCDRFARPGMRLARTGRPLGRTSKWLANRAAGLCADRFGVPANGATRPIRHLVTLGYRT
jgi:hypothetical protein